MKPWYVDKHANDKPELVIGNLTFAPRHSDKLNESTLSENAAAVQNMPTSSANSVDVLDSLKDFVPEDVFTELSARVELGVRKYGSRLKTENGRDVNVDIRQEILDAIMYIQQAYLETPVGSTKTVGFKWLRSQLVAHLTFLDYMAKECE